MLKGQVPKPYKKRVPKYTKPTNEHWLVGWIEMQRISALMSAETLSAEAGFSDNAWSQYRTGRCSPSPPDPTEADAWRPDRSCRDRR